MKKMTTNWLLLRGLSRESRHWWSFPDLLKRRANASRVVCLDHPGFGTEHARRSPSTIAEITDDVRARFATAKKDIPEDTDRWSILGISLGGMVALDWCARHPDDFERCVTINTSARSSSPLERFRMTSVASLRSVLVSTLSKDAVTKERAVLRLTSSLTSDKLDEFAMEQGRWLTESPPSRKSIASQMRAAMKFHAPTTVQPPVLVLASTTDRLVSYRCSERIANQLGSRAKLALHDRGGHDLALDEPDWICERISELTSTSSTSSS